MKAFFNGLIGLIGISLIELLQIFDNCMPIIVKVTQLAIFVLTIVYLSYKIKNEKFLSKQNKLKKDENN